MKILKTLSLFLISIALLIAPKSISAAAIESEIVNIALDSLEGYACQSQNATPYEVSIYTDYDLPGSSCGVFAPGRLCLVGKVQANSYNRYADPICQNKNNGFRLSLPTALQDKSDHKLYLSINSEFQGNPKIYNSRNLYIQERIGADIFDRIIVNHGFVSPESRSDYSHFINNHLFSAFYSGSGASPIQTPISTDLSPFTGLSVTSPKDLYQVGSGTDFNSDGTPKFTFIQGGDKSFGIYYNSLANAIPNSGVFVQYNYKNPPLLFKQNEKVTMSGIFRQPQKLPDDLSSSDDSVVFYYYVLVLKDKTSGKSVWYSADIYQSREPARFPFYDFDVAFDLNNPVVHSKIIPTAQYLTPCPGSSLASMSNYQGEKNFCFSLSRTQFKSLMTHINQSSYPNKPASWSMSTNPDDYTLESFIINIEGWGIAPNTQSRIGISFKDLLIQTTPFPSCASTGPTNKPTVSRSSLSHDVFAYGVKNATNVTFPTWSSTNGQDDLVWYQGTNVGNGTWKATIDLSKHKDEGSYNTHVYLNSNTVMCGNADFTVSSTITNLAGDLNGDGKVNLYDYTELIRGFGTLYFDSDFINIITNYGK